MKSCATMTVVKRVFSLVVLLVVVSASSFPAVLDANFSEYSSLVGGVDDGFEVGENSVDFSISTFRDSGVYSVSLSKDYDDDHDDFLASESYESKLFHFFLGVTNAQYTSVLLDRVKLFLLYSSPKLPSVTFV